MFRYNNKVNLSMKIEFIKSKFIFLVVRELDFAEIINVRNKFFIFLKVGIIFAESEKMRDFLCY